MKPASTVSGMLLDEKGKPVEGFPLILSGASPHSYLKKDVTDADGGFSFGGLAENNYTLIPESTDEERAWTMDADFSIFVKEGEHIEGLIRTLVPTRRITGIVVDEKTGEPVAGCNIHAVLAPGNTWLELARDLSNDDGTFSMTVPPVDIRIEVIPATGYSKVRMSITVKKVSNDEVTGNEEYRITVNRGKTLNGTVLSPEGKPVRYAAVTNTGSPYMYNKNAWTGKVITDENGEFTLVGVENRHPIKLDLEAFDMSKKLKGGISVQPDSVETLTIQLSHSSIMSMSGRVIDENGNLLADAVVQETHEYNQHGTYYTTRKHPVSSMNRQC